MFIMVGKSWLQICGSLMSRGRMQKEASAGTHIALSFAPFHSVQDPHTSGSLIQGRSCLFSEVVLEMPLRYIQSCVS